MEASMEASVMHYGATADSRELLRGGGGCGGSCSSHSMCCGIGGSDSVHMAAKALRVAVNMICARNTFAVFTGAPPTATGRCVGSDRVCGGGRGRM